MRHLPIATVLMLQATGLSAQVLNEGLSGAWFNPATPGQGFLIDVNEEIDLFFLAWFTFETSDAKLGDPNHRWLTGQGSMSDVATGIELFSTAGGVFDDATPTTTEAIGQIAVVFDSCTSGILTYRLGASAAEEIPLARITPDVYCADLVSAASAKRQVVR